MDFGFTSEQTMLRDLTREVLSQQSPIKEVRRLMEDPLGYDSTLWEQMAEMGLQGVAVPEQFGGQGLGMVEQALVLEEMGRAVFPGPYFASAVLASSALMASGDRAQMEALLPGLASGTLKGTLAILEDGAWWRPQGVLLRAQADGDGWVLSGTKRFVPFAQAASLVLVAARTGSASEAITLFAVDPHTTGLRLTPNVGMDLTSKTSTLTFDGVRVSKEAVVGAVDQAWQPLRQTLRRAAVGAAAEQLGCARKCLELSVDYAKVREQFGQPIGSFQAVKHKCAEMLLQVETAFGATYYAAWAVDMAAKGESVDVDMAATVAKSYVSEVANMVCGNAIQLHGGIGFTWEHDLHLYFKRAKYLEPLYGDVSFHREQALQLTVAA